MFRRDVVALEKPQHSLKPSFVFLPVEPRKNKVGIYNHLLKKAYKADQRGRDPGPGQDMETEKPGKSKRLVPSVSLF